MIRGPPWVVRHYNIAMLTQPTDLQRTLMRRAALLFLLAMVTGVWAAVVLTHGAAIGLELDFTPKFERLVLGAHLNGVLGTFWLLGAMVTLESTRFDDRGKVRFGQITTLAAYGNWAVTLLASILDVRGLSFDGTTNNKIIAGLLQVLVVIPTFIGAALWVYGLSGKRKAA
jgi:hypothetical protein